MRRIPLAGALPLACLTCFITAGTARSLSLPLSPLHERVSTADCIVVGKVAVLEGKTVTARTLPKAPQKSEYRIASVNVIKALHGVKGLTEIRVGFVVPQQVNNGGIKVDGGGFRPHIRIYGGPPQPSLTKGQEGLLFLTKHFEENFYTFGFQGVINKQNNANFDKDLTVVKRCLKLLEKPKTALKSKDASDRLLTAAMLISRYRTLKLGSQAQTAPIDAEQSKLILATLAEADLSKYDPQLQMVPIALFYRLGVTAKDGWTPPRDFQQANASVKEWLQKNAGTYRIQRYVTTVQGKKGDRKIRK